MWWAALTRCQAVMQRGVLEHRSWGARLVLAPWLPPAHCHSCRGQPHPHRCTGTGRKEGKMPFSLSWRKDKCRDAVLSHPVIARGAWVTSWLSASTHALCGARGARWWGQHQLAASVVTARQPPGTSCFLHLRLFPASPPLAAHQLCMHMDLGTSIWLNVYEDMKHFQFCRLL